MNSSHEPRAWSRPPLPFAIHDVVEVEQGEGVTIRGCILRRDPTNMHRWLVVINDANRSHHWVAERDLTFVGRSAHRFGGVKQDARRDLETR